MFWLSGERCIDGPLEQVVLREFDALDELKDWMTGLKNAFFKRRWTAGHLMTFAVKCSNMQKCLLHDPGS